MNYTVSGTIQYSNGTIINGVRLSCLNGVYRITIGGAETALDNPSTYAIINFVNGSIDKINVRLNAQIDGIWFTGIFS